MPALGNERLFSKPIRTAVMAGVLEKWLPQSEQQFVESPAKLPQREGHAALSTNWSSERVLETEKSPARSLRFLKESPSRWRS